MSFDPHANRPKTFDIQKFIDVVKMFVEADEVITALEFLDKMPSYFRDFPPKEIMDLRREITSKIPSIKDYMNYKGEHYEESLANEIKIYGDEFKDLGDFIDTAFCYPRAQKIIEEVREYNNQGLRPHIIEMGPANYWIPHGLIKKGLLFSYFPITINQGALLSHKKHLPPDIFQERPNSPKIFICFEVIEHLWDLNEVRRTYDAHNIDADIVMISTPRHTMMGGVKYEERSSLEHLRTFSTNDLTGFVIKNFPGYSWKISIFDMQVVVGKKNS